MKLHSIDKEGREAVDVTLEPADFSGDMTYQACNCQTFAAASRFKKLSKLSPKNPTGTAQWVPIQTITCTQCGQEYIEDPAQPPKNG